MSDLRKYGASDKLDFGKHRCKTVEWVVENDPSYICWMVEEGIAELPQDVYDKALENDANNSPPESFFYQPD